MKKLLLILLATISATTLLAASKNAGAGCTGCSPYTGTFAGTLYTATGEGAPLTLHLTQEGKQVSGRAALAETLAVDGGRCGAGTLSREPAALSGRVSGSDPHLLHATMTSTLSGFTVTLVLNATLNYDIMTSEAQVRVPWFCGEGPSLRGVFVRRAPPRAANPP